MSYSPVNKKKKTITSVPYARDRLRARKLISQVKNRSRQNENPTLYQTFQIHLEEYTHLR